jgi:pilus assembly protein Flp/PilA
MRTLHHAVKSPPIALKWNRNVPIRATPLAYARDILSLRASKFGGSMNTLFLKILANVQSLMNREDGQDLVEYALLVALVALVAVAGVNQVASAINTVFSSISTTLA